MDYFRLALFRNKRFMLDETFDRKASKFVIILEYKSVFFFSCCSTISPSRLRWNNSTKWKTKRITCIFVFQKYCKFWRHNHLINKHKPKPLLSEKSCSIWIHLMISTNGLNLLNKSKVEWTISWWLFVFLFQLLFKKMIECDSQQKEMLWLKSYQKWTLHKKFIFFTEFYI